MRMQKQIMLITGANRGIGLETARQLAVAGHTVLLGSRSVEKGEAIAAPWKAAGHDVHVVELAVDEPQSRKAAAQKIQQQFGRLDVMVNNAAILLRDDTNLLKNDLQLLEQTVHVNAFAPLALVKLFEPMMPGGSRVIMMSSGGGSMTDPVGGWSPAYCVSKSMLGAITRHLAYELIRKPILVNAVDPGWVKTDMGGTSAPRSVAQGADTVVWLATDSKSPTGHFFRDRKIIPW